MPIWEVILLGLIEGVTEFLPVSSTGHLLLTEHFLGVCTPGKTFEVLIQLGAILAILSVYAVKAHAHRLRAALRRACAPLRPRHSAWRSCRPQSSALRPTTSSRTCCSRAPMLDRDHADRRWRHSARGRPHATSPCTTTTSWIIRRCSPSRSASSSVWRWCPGVSRSGATIVGAMLMGTDKRSAAEFSFFLAMPTMTGAFASISTRTGRSSSRRTSSTSRLGFVVAFIAAVFVVRYLLDYVSRHGFALFGWWRIIVGGLALGAMLVLGDTSACPA